MNLDYSKFIEILGEELELQLSSKTGWGRNEVMLDYNEVMLAYNKACVKAIMRISKDININLT